MKNTRFYITAFTALFGLVSQNAYSSNADKIQKTKDIAENAIKEARRGKKNLRSFNRQNTIVLLNEDDLSSDATLESLSKISTLQSFLDTLKYGDNTEKLNEYRTTIKNNTDKIRSLIALEIVTKEDEVGILSSLLSIYAKRQNVLNNMKSLPARTAEGELVFQPKAYVEQGLLSFNEQSGEYSATEKQIKKIIKDVKDKGIYTGLYSDDMKDYFFPEDGQYERPKEKERPDLESKESPIGFRDAKEYAIHGVKKELDREDVTRSLRRAFQKFMNNTKIKQTEEDLAEIEPNDDD